MTAIPDERLHAYADRVKGKVVLITGAANGIGREAALQFASAGAKVVIADRDEANAQKVVSEIISANGTASSIRTDVTVWEDQVAMFEHAIETYGSVDVVVANAGITEYPPGGFRNVVFKDGKPQPLSMRTLDVNLKGVCWTAHLAQHYLLVNRPEGAEDLKSLILIGSIASWVGLPLAELYTASKHAVLGLMRALHARLEMNGIRVGCIHPWFAATDILDIPLGGAIFYAATDPDPETNGAAWLLPDDGPVVKVVKEQFKLGVYAMVDQRVNAVTAGLKRYQVIARAIGDVWLLSKPLRQTALPVIVAGIAWRNREQIASLAMRIQQ
ncbi:hypothetical protein BKA70DRAFT_1421172 [Coprinopsis sp. MPI-PUGE-AT-0042]|nr:hypothetical protein BKA70DRAFT_1421172 [Coprinopsis sp. MPI-PUGE-AT-0042]